MYVHVCHFHLYNWSAPSCYSSTAAYNDCYSELAPYTALAYSYRVSLHDAYECQGHTHKWYRLQSPYNSCRTCLTNRIGFISCHITSLVINSLRGRHTYTQTRTHIDFRTETIIKNQTRVGLWPVHAWFKKNCQNKK